MWPSPPAPITAQVVPGYSRGIALRTAWYAVMPASASAATSLRPGGRVELDAGARRREEQLGHPAVGVEPGEHALAAMHVVSCATGPAQSAGGRRMQDHRVAHGHVRHRRAHLVHPAGVLVPDGIGQRDVSPIRPLTEDDVQVGPTDARSADPYHHVERTLYGRLRHLLNDGLLMVFVQSDSLHQSSSSSPTPMVAYRSRSIPRHTEALACMPIPVSRARRRCRGSAWTPTASPRTDPPAAARRRPPAGPARPGARGGVLGPVTGERRRA